MFSNMMKSGGDFVLKRELFILSKRLKWLGYLLVVTKLAILTDDTEMISQRSHFLEDQTRKWKDELKTT